LQGEEKMGDPWGLDTVRDQKGRRVSTKACYAQGGKRGKEDTWSPPRKDKKEKGKEPSREGSGQNPIT